MKLFQDLNVKQRRRCGVSGAVRGLIKADGEAVSGDVKTAAAKSFRRRERYRKLKFSNRFAFVLSNLFL